MFGARILLQTQERLDDHVSQTRFDEVHDQQVRIRVGDEIAADPLHDVLGGHGRGRGLFHPQPATDTGDERTRVRGGGRAVDRPVEIDGLNFAKRAAPLGDGEVRQVRGYQRL